MRAVFRVIISVLSTLLGLLIITFVIGRVLPVDPVLAVVGDHASASAYEQARLQLGLNLPLYQQFWIYLKQVLHGDLGMSLRTSRPVIQDIADVFPATLELATAGTLIGVIIGVPTGVWAAIRKDRWPDHMVRFVGLFGYSVPVFWLGLMGLLLFYAKLEWLPGPGRIDFGFEDSVEHVTGIMLIDAFLTGDMELVTNAFMHLILPASILGYFSLAYISRMTRSLMLGQLRQEYILTARVKGVPERVIIWRHAMGNILVPLLTVIVLSYASLLEGSVLTETVFVWNGIGLYITNSLFAIDMTAVLGGTLVIGVIFIFMNMLTDIAYRVLDPRAK